MAVEGVATAMDMIDREEGAAFPPRFSAEGLLTCVTVEAGDGAVLMVAHMNAEALEKTLATGVVHYWSRSRGALWRKGDTSGQIQRLVELARRLRPGCAAGAGRGRRRRRRLPHRAALVFLSQGRTVGRRARVSPKSRLPEAGSQRLRVAVFARLVKLTDWPVRFVSLEMRHSLQRQA